MVDFGLGRRAIFANALVFGLLCSNCSSQQNALPVTAPMQVVAGLVYLQGRVNDSSPLNVILDSGASVSIVSPPLAEILHLTSTHSSQASGIAKGSDQTVHFVDDCELKWGSQANQISLSHQQSAILPIHYIAEQVGTPVDAIFGSNIFLHYTITVDYERQQVTFSSPLSGTALPGTAIPVQLVSNTPFVEASIEGEDGKKVNGLFLVDSGTTGAVILNKKFLEAHPGLISTNHFVDTPTVTAVGGTIVSKRVRVAHLGVGPFIFSGVVASVPEANAGPLSNANVAGFIGAGILKRFTVTWDYTGKRMMLLPNRTLDEPFETDASGLHLVSPGPQYRIVLIDSVLPGSPAAKTGLEVGDEILAVDKVSGLPLWKISEAFHKAGTSVVLTVRRKTAILKIKLPLQSPFSDVG